MERTRLGPSDLQVSRLCLGTMQFGWTASEEASFAVLDAYVAAGGNFIDTADIYSSWKPGNRGGESEETIGRWLAARGNRAGMVLATKVRGRMWPGPAGEGLNRRHIIQSCEYSLKRLQVETIDLYQFHWFDDAVPIDESLRAIEELIAAGKVRYVGCSNHPPAKLAAALDAAAAAGLPSFVSLQPHHNLVHRGELEAALQELCITRGLAVIPYSPLAKGFLTGKYTKGGPKVESARANGMKEYRTDAGWAALDAVREVAAARATTCAAVALAWQLAQPGITAPIVGANSPAQLADQLPALLLGLSAEELARLDAASRPFLAGGVTPG
ncbi:MAG: aldo/keto reductase [Dehalococcoidia bacterium]